MLPPTKLTVNRKGRNGDQTESDGGKKKTAELTYSSILSNMIVRHGQLFSPLIYNSYQRSCKPKYSL